MKPVSTNLFFLLAMTSVGLCAQTNLYRNVNWATLPDGRTWGTVGDLDVAAGGEDVWAVVRGDATALDRFGNE